MMMLLIIFQAKKQRFTFTEFTVFADFLLSVFDRILHNIFVHLSNVSAI